MFVNARALQLAWTTERLGRAKAGISARETALAQAKEFRPDVVWLDVADEALIRSIRDEVPSVKLVLGWMGSLLPDDPAWHQTDLMLSCAPEIVSILEQRGHRAAHLHHGFDPRVESRLVSRAKRWDVSFVGQIPTGEVTHSKRAILLDRVRREADVAIFSPDGSPSARETVKARLRGVAGTVGRGLLHAGLPERTLRRIPKLARAALDRPASARGLPRGLKSAIRPPVFGLTMFQVLRDSRATLNVHADFSPRFAGNVKLFEATGMGACLVTDWKENLADLFDMDREVVSFRDVDELVEKLRLARGESRGALGHRRGRPETHAPRSHLRASRRTPRRLDPGRDPMIEWLGPLVQGPAKHLLRLARDRDYRSYCSLDAKPGEFPDAKNAARGGRMESRDSRRGVVSVLVSGDLRGAHARLSAGQGRALHPGPRRQHRAQRARVQAASPARPRHSPRAGSEPVQILTQNVHGNGFTDVTLIPKAAWREDARLPFAPDGADGGRAILGPSLGADPSARRLDVEAIGLPELLRREAFDYIKMDIEGAERVVLPACAGLLGGVSRMFVEYHGAAHETSALGSVLAPLEEAGFHIQVQTVRSARHPFLDGESGPGFDLILHIYATRV